MVWSHSSAAPVRYRALDMSEGGLRIRSSLPLKEGTLGCLVSLLPAGTKVNRPFQVVWCRKSSGDPIGAGGFEAGLRFTAAA